MKNFLLIGVFAIFFPGCNFFSSDNDKISFPARDKKRAGSEPCPNSDTLCIGIEHSSTWNQIIKY